MPEGTVVDRAYIDMLFGEGCVISVEILSKGAGKPTNKENYSISSSLSATRTAGRLAGVSTLQLIRPEDADKKSYFNARLITENIEDYSDKTFIIKIGEHTFSTERDKDRASADQNLYQFKLMTIKETGNEGKTLWEVINNTIKENYNQGMFEVEIYIEGQDSDDILGAATLDSAVARISYTFTGSVKGIQMISNGMIGWNAVSYDLNESKWVDGDARIGDIFEIIFYDKDGKYLESLEYIHKSNAGVESTDAGAGTGDDTETKVETLTTDYIYDISAIDLSQPFFNHSNTMALMPFR